MNNNNNKKNGIQKHTNEYKSIKIKPWSTYQKCSKMDFV